MFLFIGDIHCNIKNMNSQLCIIDKPDATVIQIGDYCLRPYDECETPIQDTYFITGNHDYEPALTNLTKPTLIAPKLTYIPRGTVMELEGIKIGFLGGAESRDKWMRVPGISWFPEESITDYQLETLITNAEAVGGIDLLVTHAPPAVILSHLFGITDIDHSSKMVEIAWTTLGKPYIVCGHMHDTAINKVKGVAVLGISSILGLDPTHLTEGDSIEFKTHLYSDDTHLL